MATTEQLPAEFSDLKPYLAWDLATEPERYAKRLASSMPEMQAFYDVAFPRVNDVIEYCDPKDVSGRCEPTSDVHIVRLVSGECCRGI